MKAIIKEFREFAVRGNVIDMAVGVIIGAAFGKIATSLTNDVIMPPISMLLGSGRFEGLTWVLRPELEGKPAVVLNLGTFVTTVMDFVIVAFVIFMLVKQINRLKARPAQAGIQMDGGSAENAGAIIRPRLRRHDE